MAGRGGGWQSHGATPAVDTGATTDVGTSSGGCASAKVTLVGTKTSAKKPADIGTATLTWASEKSGSKYTLQAKGKAYCFGSSSGGSSWESFSLTISGTL